MRFLRQSLIGIFLLSLTAGLLLTAVDLISGAVADRVNQEPRAAHQRERVFTVNVVRATPGDVVPELTVFGEIHSQRTLELRASASGTLVQLSPAFRDGGQVKSGDVLAEIDTADAQDAVNRAEIEKAAAETERSEAELAIELAQADLDVARTQADLRAKALERQQSLTSRGVGTTATIETAEFNLASARQQEVSRRVALAQAEARRNQVLTRLIQAEISLNEAKRHLQDRTITAEFDGTLADVTAVRGGLVSTNERLGQLIDPNALEVSFRVSTAQYTRLLDESGRLQSAPIEVRLNVSGAALNAKGRISRDSAAVGEGQTGRLIFATLVDTRGLKPGDFVEVSIQEPPLPSAVVLPASALSAQGQVMVVGEEDRLEALDVTLLRRQGDLVLVRSPQIGGRDIVTRLTPALGAGIRVRPTNPDAPPEPTEEQKLLDLSEERRAKLLAFVEGNSRMPAERKARIVEQLSQPKVPVAVVERLEQRMGG